jgi:hypothetical protein
MKKLLNAKSIFNVLVYSALLWSILSAIYVALPIEYQAMLPFMNEGTAIIGGVTTALGGTGGLAVVHFLNKTKYDNTQVNKTVVEQFLTIKEEYGIMKDKVDKLESGVQTNNKLLKIDLKTKLDNPLITDTARQAIEGAIYEEE